MTGQRVTRELLATLRPGDVVELRSTAGPEVLVRAELAGWPPVAGQTVQQLVVGHPEFGMVLSTWEGNPAGWAFGMDLTVVSRVPRLYENSTRTEPAVGDIVRDKDGDAWIFHAEHSRWLITSNTGCIPRDTSALQRYAPLTLLWDAATGSLPGASS